MGAQKCVTRAEIGIAGIQVVFQDPYGSFNPRWRVERLVAEPFHLMTDPPTDRRARVAEGLKDVGIDPAGMDRYIHEFSGGQRQRIGIARALASGPDLLLLDEPTSALDVSVQAQVLNLLIELQDRLGLTYFFISHDLAVVRYLCDRVALIHHGSLVEEGPTDRIFDAPQTDYARMLIGAAPELRVP